MSDLNYMYSKGPYRERSGSMVECLTGDRRARGSSLTGVTALWSRHIYPSLVLVQPRKTRPYITEKLLMGRKELNQTNKQTKGPYQWNDPFRLSKHM